MTKSIGEDLVSFTYSLFEKLPIVLPAKCIVHFRPKVDWKGEGYGFDWMRLGDTAIFGDMKPYKEIVSKQYVTAGGALETGINTYSGHFDPTTAESMALYEKLKLEYKPFLIVSKRDSVTHVFQQYFCSWLSLYPSKVDELKLNVKSFADFLNPKPKENTIPYRDAKTDRLIEIEEKPSGYSNTKAELRLYIDVIEQPDRLEFEYSKEYFKVSPEEITNDLGVGKRFWDGGKTIEVECLKEFSDDEKIDVYAIKKDPVTNEDVRRLAGRLYVFANHAPKRKKVKALLVRIKTPPIQDDINFNTGSISGQKEMFEKYLRQTLIDVEVDSYVLDLSADPEFIQPAGKFVSGNRVDDDKVDGNDMIGHMEGKLKDQLKSEGKDENMYDGVFKAFYFEEPGTSNGYFDPYTGHVVLYNGRSPETPSHEFMHKFLVSHSFANHECHVGYLAGFKSDCTYEYNLTENLMDYSHHSGNLRYALWHWQWVVANQNAK